VAGAKGRLADRQRPLILFSCPFQTWQAVGKVSRPRPASSHRGNASASRAPGGTPGHRQHRHPARQPHRRPELRFTSNGASRADSAALW